MIYFTSDWHFNHDKDFIYEPRGFSSVHEMNEAIIERHNEIVKPEDVVYVLGDLCLGGGSDEAIRKNKKIISSLKGEIKIILGNHDTKTRVAMYYDCWNTNVLGYADVIKYGKQHIYMSHYPSFTSNLDYDKPLSARLINVFGHTHSSEKFYEGNPLMYNVAMDAHNCYPVSIDTVIEDIERELKALPDMTRKAKDIRPYISFLDRVLRRPREKEGG